MIINLEGKKYSHYNEMCFCHGGSNALLCISTAMLITNTMI